MIICKTKVREEGDELINVINLKWKESRTRGSVVYRKEESTVSDSQVRNIKNMKRFSVIILMATMAWTKGGVLFISKDLTLNQMYIVNAGSGFKLVWNTARSFLDPRMTAKIHVLGNKFQNRLLEVIDSSQLPDFLGGTCVCPGEDGCLRSDKGPGRIQN
ncbi:hypothetical protein RHGRI_001055 [Rhododendron griersonianum]|uniref:CRAL-TRIO domain-containing protein n=1 Tax=Rhododendron griersonianum TaxID=479676 RepID=A0AAV6LIV0_9ERIC|nr:hypothetical protein RHGRI_001055 [Rhododendron griersonianum]